MTFRPFFIYLASVFILIGCVSGASSGESCKSSADYFGNTKLYHTILGSKQLELARDAQKAYDAHHRLADAHSHIANYWQEVVAPSERPFENFTHPNYLLHMNAMRLHRGKATDHATSRDNILKRKSKSIDSMYEGLYLGARYEHHSSKGHATAGLMQLHASIACEKASELAFRAGDHEEGRRLHQSMCDHALRSLNHIPPNAAHSNSKDAILNAKSARHHANKISRKYKEQEHRTLAWLFS